MIYGVGFRPNAGIEIQQNFENRVTQLELHADQHVVCELAPIKQSFDSLIWRKFSVVLGQQHEWIDPALFPKPNRHYGVIRMRW